MSIAVRCPNQECRHLVRVAASLRGQHIQCPACGAGLRIPEAEPKVSLEDTPPELDAIKEAPATPKVKRRKAGRAGAPAAGESVADGAAIVTSAVSPVLKLVAVVVVLAGLIVLGVKVIFPMLWSDRAISSVSQSAQSEIEEMVSGPKAQPPPEQRPIDETSRSRILAAIESGDLIGARKLLDIASADPSIQDDIAKLRLEFRAALNAQIKSIYEAVDEFVLNKQWKGAREKLAEIDKLDASESHTRSYTDRVTGIDGGEARDFVDQSKQAAAAKDFETARVLADKALFLYRNDQNVASWSKELLKLAGAGAIISTGGVVADVFLDGEKIGDTSRTIWQLPANKRIRLQFRAPDHVPRETLVTLLPFQAKQVEVRLVRAAPDTLWVARLLEADALRWLACRVMHEELPEVKDYCGDLAHRCASAKTDPKKRKVWRIRMDGKTIYGLEFSTLGNTVRFINLATGETKRTTTDKVHAEGLSLETGAKRWLSIIDGRAVDARDPCEAFSQYGRFVEVFPDKIDLVVERGGDRLAGIARGLAGLVSCGPGVHDRREAMDISDRLDAEIETWKQAGLEPPAALLEQKRNRR